MSRVAALWVVYRQQRAQIVLTTGLVILAAWFFLIFAMPERSAGCPPSADCSELTASLQDQYQSVAPLLPYLGLCPVLVGVFWGAPVLAREYEGGTASLAWTQSVTRTRWLTQRLILLSALVLSFGLVLGLSLSAWLRAFSGLDLPGVPPRTDLLMVRGIVPAFYWLTALLIGMAWGAVLRRVVPAMAATAGSMLGVTVFLNLAQNLLFNLHANDMVRSSVVIGALLLPLAAVAGTVCWRLVHRRPAG